MTDELVATARANPDQVPELAEIKRIFEYCLGKAERTFGKRDSALKYSICLRKCEEGPETIPSSQEDITVWLSRNRSRVGYYFEAAHEAVHCLGPDIPSGSGSYLEEAIAAVFSLQTVHSVFGPAGLSRTMVTPDYQRAIEITSKIDHDILGLGKQLREWSGAFGRISAEDIQNVRPNAPESYVHLCLTKIPRQ